MRKLIVVLMVAVLALTGCSVNPESDAGKEFAQTYHEYFVRPDDRVLLQAINPNTFEALPFAIELDAYEQEMIVHDFVLDEVTVLDYLLIGTDQNIEVGDGTSFEIDVSIGYAWGQRPSDNKNVEIFLSYSQMPISSTFYDSQTGQSTTVAIWGVYMLQRVRVEGEDTEAGPIRDVWLIPVDVIEEQFELDIDSSL